MKASEFTPLQTNIGGSLQYNHVQLKDDSEGIVHFLNEKKITYSRFLYGAAVWVALVFSCVLLIANFSGSAKTHRIAIPSQSNDEFSSTFFEPLSSVNPHSLLLGVDREFSSPGSRFGNAKAPIPTNQWSENMFLGQTKAERYTNAYQIPYIIDAVGPITGLRIHHPDFVSNKYSIFMDFDRKNGLTLGSMEEMLNETLYMKETYLNQPGLKDPRLEQHAVHMNSMTTSLQWKPMDPSSTSYLLAPIARGSPYITMEFYDATPRIMIQRALLYMVPIVRDEGTRHAKTSMVQCGTGLPNGDSNFSVPSFRVHKDMYFSSDVSDQTWMVFVSEPTDFRCSVPYQPDRGQFELRAVKPMRYGVVRVALAYECTKGLNPVHCNHTHVNETLYSLKRSHLRKYSAMYPSPASDVSFIIHPENQETANIQGNYGGNNEEENNYDEGNNYEGSSGKGNKVGIVLDWVPKSMYHTTSHDKYYSNVKEENSVTDVLIYALPHHQSALRPYEQSLNQILPEMCMVTLHGKACAVIGSKWYLEEELQPISFHAPRPVREEVLPQLQLAVAEDINYHLKRNYVKGIGDTYFSAKMLAKLGRILIIAEEVGMNIYSPPFLAAVKRLEAGIEIWLNGSAENPFVYDAVWGGVISCGCLADAFSSEDMQCLNSYPTCPSTTNQMENFGIGFYNDHHYHFGYFVYAAAVAVKYDHEWGRKMHEHILLLIRDIANPSREDGFFPTFRHKDWYLGSSWASGIITLLGTPYPFPMGRNQESTSEAISAYEAVALYGKTAAEMFRGIGFERHRDRCLRIYRIGSILTSTEIRSAEIYWHIHGPDLEGKPSKYPVIYPDTYQHKVIGRLWSEMAELNTFFGPEEWKSYGIQLLPTTPIAEYRDDPNWLREAFHVYNQSCRANELCINSGWQIILYLEEAALCNWRYALDSIATLDPHMFLDYGGDGQSKSNALWWVGSRPCP